MQRAWQLPKEQSCPAAQRLPHEPQLSGSLRVMTQVPPQRAEGNGQVSVQMPSAQAAPAGHVVPQLPQFDGSFWRFTHDAPQVTLGAGQVVRHIPAEHT